MNDKELLETYLTLTKSINVLYLNGTIESANKEVILLMNEGLNKTLDFQEAIFKVMKKDGLYNIENAKKSKIMNTLNSLISTQKNC